MSLKPITFLIILAVASGFGSRAEAQSACRKFTVTGIIGDGSTPLPFANIVAVMLDAPGGNMGPMPIPGSKSFGAGPRTDPPYRVYLHDGNYYFHAPYTTLGTCTFNEALQCSDCDGTATLALYAKMGNLDGTVTDCVSGAGSPSRVDIWSAEAMGGGSKTADAAGYFNFRQPFIAPGGNEWGLGVLVPPSDNPVGSAAGPGSATYTADAVGPDAGTVSLGPVTATVRSSQLTTIQLYVRKAWVKEPGRCKPRVVSTRSGGPTPSEPSTNAGKPVNVVSGNVWFDLTDASVAVDGSSLSLVRSYNSVNRDVVGVLGRGWSHSFERRLNITNPQSAQRVVEFVDSDGSRIYYQDRDTDNKFVAQYPRSNQHWIMLSGGVYTRQFQGGGSETYDSTGKLTAETDPQGRTKTYAYSGSQLTSVSSSGRSLTFAYNTNGRLTTVTGPGNELLITYFYGPPSANTADTLERVEYGDGTGYFFQYQGFQTTLLLTAVYDLEGKSIERHTYDASSRGITSEIADGQERYTFAYGTGSTTVTDALGRATVYNIQLVAGERRVTKITGPCAGCGGSGSDVQEWTYDTQGRVLTRKDAEGGITTYTYASATSDDVTSVQFTKPTANPPYTEPPTTYEYTNGFLSKVTGVDGAATQYERNAIGDVTKIKDPLLRETSMAYTSGRVSSITDPRLKTTTMGYHATTGDLLTVTDPLAHATTFAYNNRGQRTTVTDALNHVTTTTYNLAGRVTKVTNHDGTFTSFKYDKGGRRVEVLDPLNKSTRYLYDTYGRLTSVTDPANGVTRYAYDLMGNLTSLTDAKNQTTSFEYNDHNQVKKTIYPGGAFEVFTYDTLSRLVSMVDRKNVTTTYSYDAKSRLVGKSFSDGTPAFSYTYDLAGRMLTAANGTDTLSWAYNLAGELLSEQSTKNASTVAYQYDAGGNRIEVRLDGTVFVTYAYDDASRLTTITRNGANFTFAYDNANRRTTMAYPNGVTTAYTYDALNRLTNLAATHVPTNTPITNFGYVYDAAGNRTQKSTLDFTEVYGYDELYRLTGATRTGATPNRWAWSYDAVGNRVTNQTGDSGVLSASYNEKNQLLGTTVGGPLLVRGQLSEPALAKVNGQAARMLGGNLFEATIQAAPGTNTFSVDATDDSGNTTTKNYSVSVAGTPATYTYDANGNLTQKVEGPDTWTYTWNAMNQLIAVSKNGVSQASYKYDPMGRRVEKIAGTTTTGWTYDAEDIVRQVAGGTTTTFTHGPGPDEPLAQTTGATTEFLHADAMSSIVRHTTSAGAIAQTVAYDVWGNIESGTPALYGFTSRERDDAARLDFYRARWYDSSVGRFLSEDPIRTLEMQPYHYALNSPAVFGDPSGEIAWAYPIACQLVVGTKGSLSDVRDPNNQKIHCQVACETNRYCYFLLAPTAAESAQKNYEKYRGYKGDWEGDNTAAMYGIWHSYKIWRSCRKICDELPCPV